MKSEHTTHNEHCLGCVYYPENLPPDAYSPQDYRILRQKTCCFDLVPGDANCNQTRKTSCSLVNLEDTGNQPIKSGQPS